MNVDEEGSSEAEERLKNYSTMLTLSTQCISTLSKDKDLRRLLCNARAADLCAPIVSGCATPGHSIPKKAVLMAASACVLLGQVEGTGDDEHLDSTQASAMREIEKLLVDTDPSLRGQALDQFLGLAMDSTRTMPLLHSGLLKTILTFVEGARYNQKKNQGRKTFKNE
jgi:hypothetical protein